MAVIMAAIELTHAGYYPPYVKVIIMSPDTLAPWLGRPSTTMISYKGIFFIIILEAWYHPSTLY